MEATTRWTDDRMDDLRSQVESLALCVDEGFRELRTEMRELRAEMREMRTEMNARFDAVNARFDSVNARFDAMQRVMIMFAASMFAAMLGLIATQL